MKIALVYDRINKYGGAERVLEALHDIWPDAPLFTAIYDEKLASFAHGWDIRPSFLQKIPFAREQHELYPWLTQLAFETFDLSGFDVVISVTSAEAKAVITRPETLHICYCLTPTRYLWSGYQTYLNYPGLGRSRGVMAKSWLRYLAPTLRRWDLIAASRPDYYIAISRRVSDRIVKYYQRSVSGIIYPPVEASKFGRLATKDSRGAPKGQYYLTVARLVGYKRLDLIIKAFNELQLNLLIIGMGKQEKELRDMAGPAIQFVTKYLTDAELVGYYRGAKAFVYAADEDFGIAAVEAQALGVPVVAFADSGIAESVVEAKTGFLFASQTTGELINAIRKCETANIKSTDCEKQAKKFTKLRFQQEFADFVRIKWSEQQKNL